MNEAGSGFNPSASGTWLPSSDHISTVSTTSSPSGSVAVQETDRLCWVVGLAGEIVRSVMTGPWLSDPTVMAGDSAHSDKSAPSEARTCTVQTSPTRVATAGSVMASSSEFTWTPSSIQRTSVEVMPSPSTSLVW